MDKPDYLIRRQRREELGSHRVGWQRGGDRRPETVNWRTQIDDPTEALGGER